MGDPGSLSQLLQVCVRKTEDFVYMVDNKHMVWLLEIEEAAKKMFSSDFTAEPELMPKTPSQKRRRKKRSNVTDENRDSHGRRASKRRSSVSWSSSVRRLSTRQTNKQLDNSIKEESEQPKRVTRARAQASTACPPVSEKPLQANVSMNSDPRVKISAEERRSAEQQLAEIVALDSVQEAADIETGTGSSSPASRTEGAAIAPDTLCGTVTPERSRTAAKLKIAESSKTLNAEKEIDNLTNDDDSNAVSLAASATCLSSQGMTPTGSKTDRRSVRRSIVGRKSISSRPSLASQYSLTKKRESIRKSLRRSVSKKKTRDTSISVYKSYQSSIEVVDDEVTVKIKPDTAVPAEEVLTSPTRSPPSRACKKIAISNQSESDEPRRIATRQSMTSSDGEPTKNTSPQESDDQTIRRKSYKRAVDERSDDETSDDEQMLSPPRKKTPSPPCPLSKVVKPPPHMKTFLHTVQKNQFLMMTPGSISKTMMVKSFIKRNTPLKTDPKEKERQRLETLRKKEEVEMQRKQKVEESKKRKQEELKLRREERWRKVLQARERVEQMEEEKKKKIEQKFAQIDEKSEKVREDRLAEEKAKKKITNKKQEELENRRRQEEEARKLKAKQLEEEERRHQEILQKKREEEEQERHRKFAEAKRLAEQRQADQERERQIAAEREQERLRAERERLEKEKTLQLQRELERAAQEQQQRRAEEERKRKEQQERLEQERQERLRKEAEARRLKELEAQRLREEQERIAKQKQAAASAPTLNVTVDIENSPPCESYEMTPKGYKPHPPKLNIDDYGMDLNSDDSTDDESKPRKPIPAWASGSELSQSIQLQYYRPMDLDKVFGKIESPKLEDMFNKKKPRYKNRTSSAVWHSPPLNCNRPLPPVGLTKY
ncbi:inner centromere protein isoform X2 [Hyperolius riggenbachi]|uniref:inner centromere protein isoform X2 n=1 Tax=Hyperolius riggenbachi TaxID=752182 RepID=UPI0035A36EC0